MSPRLLRLSPGAPGTVADETELSTSGSSAGIAAFIAPKAGIAPNLPRQRGYTHTRAVYTLTQPKAAAGAIRGALYAQGPQSNLFISDSYLGILGLSKINQAPECIYTIM